MGAWRQQFGCRVAFMSAESHRGAPPHHATDTSPHYDRPLPLRGGGHLALRCARVRSVPRQAAPARARVRVGPDGRLGAVRGASPIRHQARPRWPQSEAECRGRRRAASRARRRCTYRTRRRPAAPRTRCRRPSALRLHHDGHSAALHHVPPARPITRCAVGSPPTAHDGHSAALHCTARTSCQTHHPLTPSPLTPSSRPSPPAAAAIVRPPSNCWP